MSSAPPIDSAKSHLEQLLQVMAILRGPGGCPWDQEQTHTTIKPQLLEECYEVLEAIDSASPEHLREELGDLLLHVVFHAQLAREAGQFDFEAVSAGIVEKLVRRHPHVFAGTSAATSAEVLKNWDEIKKMEKPERKGLFDGIPKQLPALMRAEEIQKKAAKVGFDWSDAQGPLEKIREETEEVTGELKSGGSDALAEEIGDLLFAVVNLARHVGVDAEQALRGANDKFQKRFEQVEAVVKARGKKMGDCTLAELDAVWDEIKKNRPSAG